MENASTVQKFLRSELSFYITLISAVVAIAGFYFGISNQINLISQRLEIHVTQTADLPSKVAELREQMAVLLSKTYEKS